MTQTKYTFADFRKIAAHEKAKLNAVARQWFTDLLATAEVVPGINRGGDRVRGTIPRDYGTLAASQQAQILGGSGTRAEGADAYIFAGASIEAGDVVQVSWGGPAASYAYEVHYGANGVPGTFWVDELEVRSPTVAANAIIKVRERMG